MMVKKQLLIMKTNALLQNNTQFAGYTVVGKLSTHHDGEREVYLVRDADDEVAVLVVYDLDCDRYVCKNVSRRRTPDFIEEVKVCSDLKNQCFPGIIKRGIDKVGNKRYAWTVLRFVEGNCLDNEIRMRRAIPLSDTIRIAKQLTEALRELTDRTGGGSHYNLRPENIIVDYDNDVLKGVYVVGMTCAGMASHGNPPFSDGHLSNLYRAPETASGVFNHTADVYSIGMLMLIMLLGDKVSDRYGYSCISPTAEGINDEDTGNHKWHEPAEWNKIVWDCADESLSTAARLILRKVTAVSSSARLQTFDKLYKYLVMLEKKSIKTSAVTEPGGITGNLAPLKKEVHETVRSAGTPVKTGFSQSASGKGLDEVAGMSELKTVLRRNFVDIVKHRQMAGMYGITPPNGILLYGAPGCGKTFVAEKAAQESGLKYKIINPSDFASIYIHGSQGKIAEAFKEAEKNAPMILIFDEFDAIAPKRDADNNNQANEVNEILTQLNNCASKGIFVLATTNRPDMIDAACLRAGRMDEKFYVGLPDTDARKEIFAMELKKRPCDSQIDLDLLGNATSDFTCGDISYIVKETARRCFDEAIRNGDGITVPLTTEKLMEVAKATIPSVSPKDIRLYQELKDRMEHRDWDNKSRARVGFLPRH